MYSKSEEDMLAFVNTARIFSDDIRMNFSLDKCATITCKRGNTVDSTDIQIPQGISIFQPLTSNWEFRKL